MCIKTNCTKVFYLFLLLFLPITAIAATADAFPGRKLYEAVPYIEMADFNKNLKKVVVVDVRSAYEYQTLHIKGAVNITLASKSFVKKMKELRKSTDKPIVVYCNGKTCMKSYKAARKCQIEKIEGVTAFDSGVLDWAKKYPSKTLLLGETLKSADQLISKKEFTKHLITPDQFGERVASTNAIILDVRDVFQREGISIFIGREYAVNLDNTKRLNRFIAKAKIEGKDLLIYDASGKQVRWLQYYLKNKGVATYYFMKGGINQYFKEMREEELASKK